MKKVDSLTWIEEGYVVYFNNDLMVKIKGAEYLKVHKLKYDFSDKRVLEMMIEGQDPIASIKDLPDEFVDEVRKIRDDFQNQFDELKEGFFNAIGEMKSQLPNLVRKDAALWGKANLLPKFMSAYFNWLSEKDKKFEECLWKEIEKNVPIQSSSPNQET